MDLSYQLGVGLFFTPDQDYYQQLLRAAQREIMIAMPCALRAVGIGDGSLPAKLTSGLVSPAYHLLSPHQSIENNFKVKMNEGSVTLYYLVLIGIILAHYAIYTAQLGRTHSFTPSSPVGMISGRGLINTQFSLRS